MRKNVGELLIHLLIFYVIAVIMPGMESPHGSVGFLTAGFAYGLLIILLPEILRFFKFPKNIWGKLFIGSAITFIMILAISMLFPEILRISNGYIGETDFIWFTTPKIVSLPSNYAVIGFISVLLNLCSIILQFLNKGRV